MLTSVAFSGEYPETYLRINIPTINEGTAIGYGLLYQKFENSCDLTDK